MFFLLKIDIFFVLCLKDEKRLKVKVSMVLNQKIIKLCLMRKGF